MEKCFPIDISKILKITTYMYNRSQKPASCLMVKQQKEELKLRQGCLQPPLLHNRALEVLDKAVRQGKDIRDTVIRGE